MAASLEQVRTLQAEAVEALERRDWGAAEDALRAAVEALAEADGVAGGQLPDSYYELAHALSGIRGNLALQDDRFDDAIQHYERALVTAASVSPTSREVAESLASLGWALRGKGEIALSIERYRKALVILREHGESDVLTARCMSGLGASLTAAGRWEEAVAILEGAVALYQRFDPDSDGWAAAIGNLGTALGEIGDHARALEMFEAALPCLADAPGNRSTILRSAAAARLNLGDGKGALRDAEEALEFARTYAPGTQEEAAALNNLGGVRDARGETERAIECFEGAWAIHERQGPETAPAAANLVNLGRALLDRGQVADAADRLQAAAEVFARTSPRRVRHGVALDALAEAHCVAGAFGEAAARLRECRSIFGACGEVASEIRAGIKLGTLYKDRGERQRAKAELATVYARAQESGDAELVADAAMALAGALRWLGEREAAFELYRSIPDSAPGQPAVMSNLAGLAFDQGDYENAERIYRELLPEGDGAPLIRPATAFHNLATAVHGNRRYAEAAELYKEAWEQLEAGGDRTRTLVECITGLGRCRLALGEFDAAVGVLMHAIDAAESHRMQAGPAASRESLFALLEVPYGVMTSALLGRAASGDAERAFAYAERARARALSELLAARRTVPAAATEKTKRLLDEETQLRQRLAATYRRQTSARLNPLSPPELTGELAEQEHVLVERLEMVRHKLETELPGQLMTPVDAHAEVATVQATLEPGTVLIEYHHSENGLVCWGISRDQFSVAPLPAGRRRVDELVERAVAGFQDEVPTTDDAETARLELRALVIEPLEAMLRDADRLLVAADGKLHLIPFEMLLDDIPITYVPSATLATQPPPVRAGVPELDFVGFGDPDFDRSVPEFADLPALPGSRIEVEDAAAPFVHRRFFFGPEATQETVFRWAGHCRFLHLATHGIYDADNPMRSGLVLAPHLGTAREDGIDDLLHVDEMFGLSLEAEVVVCSACQTGLGDLRAGEGLVSMTRALLVAGAAQVVVSLWPVNDTITALLMSRFYGRLAAGDRPVEALRQARADVRSRHEDPYFWASFVLVGAQA